MGKFQEFLNQIYSNDDTMMYFYIILGAIALFFIILIIITSFKEKRELIKEGVKDTELSSKDIKEEVKEDSDMPKLPEFSILDEPSPDSIEKDNIEDVYIDVKPDEEIVAEEPVILEQQVIDEPIIEDEAVVVAEPVIEEEPIVSISESTVDDVALEPSIQLENVEHEITENIENEVKSMEDTFFFEGNIEDLPIKDELEEVTLFEMPEVNGEIEDEKQPLEVSEDDNAMSISELMSSDNDFNPEEVEEEFELPKMKEVKEEPAIVEEKEDLEKTIISNDLMKERLAKLKNKKKEVSEVDNPNDDLEDIMKNVGLEDTMVIPGLTDAGKQFLGR